MENPEERSDQQIDDLNESAASILDFIHAEASLIPINNIILGGISQGCATAIVTLLFSGLGVGAFIGMCGWLPFQSQLHGSEDAVEGIFARLRPASIDSCFYKPESVLSTPVFISHSQDDDIVPIQNGRMLCETLKELGTNVTWKEYQDGGHWLNEPKGVDDMAAFLQSVAR